MSAFVRSKKGLNSSFCTSSLRNSGATYLKTQVKMGKLSKPFSSKRISYNYNLYYFSYLTVPTVDICATADGVSSDSTDPARMVPLGPHSHARPRSAMQHWKSFVTRIFFDLISRWAIVRFFVTSPSISELLLSHWWRTLIYLGEDDAVQRRWKTPY